MQPRIVSATSWMTRLPFKWPYVSTTLFEAVEIHEDEGARAVAAGQELRQVFVEIARVAEACQGVVHCEKAKLLLCWRAALRLSGAAPSRRSAP